MRKTIGRRSGRRGVILIVVLALLTLFKIVGITFVLVADTSPPSLRQFREETFDLARQTLQLTRIIGPDLRNSLREEVDLSDSFAELDAVIARAEMLKSRVRAAHASEGKTDRAQRLADLCENIEDLLARLEQLRELLQKLERSRSEG